jgi:ABC-type multidrug transport system fused ATPase/permease subunit
MSRRPAIAADGRARRIAAVAALAVGQAMAAGMAAFATRDVFGALHAGGALPAPALAAIALAGGIIAGARIAERSIAERVGGEYAAALRETLFLHAARLPPSVVARRSRGGLALRFVGDLAAVRGWVARGLARLVSTAITLPASLLVIALLDWRLTLGAALPLGLGLGGLALLRHPLHGAHRRLRRIRGRLAVEATERLAHGAALRLVGRVAAERARLASRSRKLTDAAITHARLAGAVRAVPDLVGGVAAASILATAAMTGMSPGVAAGALAALALAIQPLRDLATVQDRHEAWRVAVARIDRALGAPALRPRSKARRAPDRTKPALSVETSTEANGMPPSLVVDLGGIAVIETATDDPSTLLLAAAGIEPAAGARIRVFGCPPHAVPTGTVSYVGPASPIIRGSLRRNLLLGLPGGQDDDRLLTIIERVGLADLAARLGGLDGAIAEGGRNLGRRDAARLLVARAILGDARLMLIDAAALALPQQSLDQLVDKARSKGVAALIVIRRDRHADLQSGQTLGHCGGSVFSRPPATAQA